MMKFNTKAKEAALWYAIARAPLEVFAFGIVLASPQREEAIEIMLNYYKTKDEIIIEQEFLKEEW